MAYTIDRYNGTTLTVVQDGTVDQTTDIKFVGKNYAGYGEIQNENFLNLLENFSGANQPPRAISGQVWYDSGANKLKFYDGSKFRTTGGAEVSATAPAGGSGSKIKVTGMPGQGTGGSAGTTPAKPGATAKPKAGAKATAGATQVDLPTLAKQISDAGLQDVVKGQLSQKGGGSDLGSGMQIDIPTLAQQISDAGMQQQIKQQLTQKQTA